MHNLLPQIIFCPSTLIVIAILFFFFYIPFTLVFFFFFQAEDGIRDTSVTGVQTCALPISERFLALHHGDGPLLLPNPWDVGSAKLLASLGFQALATTSSGFAATLGRLDGSVTRDEALAHAAAIVGATDLPVSADLENGFADAPAGVATTGRLALETGLAGW